MMTTACWADPLTRAERRVLAGKLARASLAVFRARPNWHEGGKPGPWLRTSAAGQPGPERVRRNGGRGELMAYGIYGHLPGLDLARIAGMSQPVRCTWCQGVYDLGTVEITGRYLDCSTWAAPCCGASVDDRGETGWKSRSDYVRLDKRTGRKVRRG